jgi:leucyl-tRNA synthetase
LMELVNELYLFAEQHPSAGRRARRGTGEGSTPTGPERQETSAVLREAIEALILMLAPFAPHIAEEMWERTGHEGGLTTAGWPTFDPEAARPEEMVVPVQVNGKVRSRLTVPVDTPESELQRLALEDPAVRNHTAGRTVRNVVVARGKLVNIVVS